MESERAMIYVDDREPPYTETMLRGAGVEAETKRLAAGDYKWGSPFGPVLVERKEAGDLVSSFYSGRLDDELYRCLEASALTFLLIEGEVSEVGGKIALPGVKRKRWVEMLQNSGDFDGLDNHLVSWQLRGVVIKHSPNAATTIYRLVSLFGWTMKEDHSKTVKRQRRLPNMGRLTERAELWAGVPGIGPKKAVTLAAAGSLREVLAWNEEKLAQTLGPAQAKKTAQFLDEEPE